MFTLLAKGGPVMIPIVFCSIVTLGIIIERFIFYRRARYNDEELKLTLENLILENKIDESINFCKENPGIITRVFWIGLERVASEEKIQKGEDEISMAENSMREEIEVNILPLLEKRLDALDALASGTPLLGLLGTVLGMIQIFFVVGSGNIGNPEKLSLGIGWALLTTAAGLIVAIPAFFAHRYFRTKVDYLQREIEKNKSWLLTQLLKRKLIDNKE